MDPNQGCREVNTVSLLLHYAAVFEPSECGGFNKFIEMNLCMLLVYKTIVKISSKGLHNWRNVIY